MECHITINKATSYPEIAIPEDMKDWKLTHASIIYDVVKDIADQGIEYAVLITITEYKRIIAARIVAIGSESEANLSQVAILQSIILDGAKGFIFVHNHPGSNTSPSSQDIKSLKGMQESAAVLGILMVDAVIVSGKNYQSILSDLADKNEEPEQKPAYQNLAGRRGLRALFNAIDWAGRITQQIGSIIMSLVILTIYYQLTNNQPLPPLTPTLVTVIMLFPIGWILCIAGQVGETLLPTRREEND